jgi:ribosomal protein L40E
MENYEEMNPLGSVAENGAVTKTAEVCTKCGATLKEGQEFCTKCGTPKKKKNVCAKCGAELQDGQEFCHKCGQKVGLAVDSNVASAIDQFNSGVAKANAKKKKTPIIIGVVLVILVLTALAFKTVAPKIFIDMEGYMEQGKYEKAYEKAKSDDNKLKVKAENAVAVQSAYSADNLKDPSSFSLRDAYYAENTTDEGKTNKQMVLYISGANSYGASISNYWLYTWSNDNNEWEYFCSVSDLSDEEYSKYDDEDEKLEKLVNNIGRSSIKTCMKDGLKLDKDSVKRINKMFEDDTLDDVDLLDVK